MGGEEGDLTDGKGRRVRVIVNDGTKGEDGLDPSNNTNTSRYYLRDRSWVPSQRDRWEDKLT